VRIRSYNEAVRLARCAGEDAANRRMRKAGRKAWSAADHDHGVRVTEGILGDLGFDVGGWSAIAGLRRNEPDAPPSRKKSKRRSRQKAPVQLSFSFG
jgi:hypothetical protein